jgi:hypothetical protein
MFFAFGVAFEVPIAVVLLVLTGLVNIKKLSDARGYVVIDIFVIAAILTPPDALSQCMMAIPMWLLYEAGILFARIMTRGRPKPEDENKLVLSLQRLAKMIHGEEGFHYGMNPDNPTGPLIKLPHKRQRRLRLLRRLKKLLRLKLLRLVFLMRLQPLWPMLKRIRKLLRCALKPQTGKIKLPPKLLLATIAG